MERGQYLEPQGNAVGPKRVRLPSIIVFLFVRFDHQRKELVRQFLGRRVLLPQDHADLLLNFAVRRRPPRLRLRGL